jgi:two-component system CheB/CheR fusion protein
MDALPIVVAVASSAGDPEAVSELVSALPADCRIALIIVQHLDPGRERSLLEALGRRTSRPVVPAHDGAAVEQGHVYVTGAKTTLTVTDGRIRATPTAGAGPHHPGDALFTSLAQDCGHRAIGVVLSGEGSDGAHGIQALRHGGGATLAQYPGSARFPSMPINAIETGCVRFVLRPNEIARELARLSGDAHESLARRVEPARVSLAAGRPLTAPASAAQAKYR